LAKRSLFGYLEDSGRIDGRGGRDLSVHEKWTESILPADADAGLTEGETDRRPLTAVAVTSAILLSLLVLRLFVLQIIQGENNLAVAEGNRVHERVSRAPRGVIYDRNRRELVRNQASFDITAVPQNLPRDDAARQQVYLKLAAMIGVSPAEVQDKAEVACKTTARPLCLRSPLPVLVAAGVSKDQALLVEQSSAEVPGMALDVNPIRQYLDEGLLSVFLGYTGRVNAEEATTHADYGPTDLIGKLGVELQYEKQLKGQNGGERTEVDATGRPVRLLASKEPQAGNSLVLSIDFELQQKLAAALNGQMVASGAKRAAGVAIRPQTGEVLAAVSLPSYDNNLFSTGISQVDYDRLRSDVGQPLFNKVVSGGYAPGSTIKPYGAAAALQEGIISTATTINDTGLLVVPNQYDPEKPALYYGWERTNGLGPVNVLSAIARSSDIFFYEIMGGFTDFLKYLGIDKLAEYYHKFGLGERSGIDIPGEIAGRVPTREWKQQLSGESWYQGDTYNVSVGQGDLLVSPLQMALATAAVANGGKLMQPYIVSQVLDAVTGKADTTKPVVRRAGFISDGNLEVVRRGMWMAVNDSSGTACCKIKDEVPVQVAAKTGTAETVIHDAGKDARDQSKPNAWFEAFAPYNNPQIAIVVLVENSGEGSQFAAPAVRETLKWYFTEGPGKAYR
jgi:penicillin-binding protein 2